MAEDVNLVDEKGNLVSVPGEQVQDAIQKAGFSYPTPQKINEYKAQQQAEEPASQVAAGVFGAARGATAGLSDVLLTMPPSEGGLNFGPAGPSSSEVLSHLEKSNPGISTATEIGGAMLGSEALTPAGFIARGGRAVSETAGEAARSALANTEMSPVVSKILSGVTNVGAKTLGSAVEGSAYGLGQSLSENALGDADLNAENILHNVGYGALYGGTLGAALGTGGELYKGVRAGKIENAALKHGIIEEAANAPTEIPTSLEELSARNDLGKELGYETELPSKDAVLSANNILAGDSNFPAHALQIQSLENPTERLKYKMLLKSDIPESKTLLDYEANQKAEGQNKLLPQYIQEIAPKETLTSNPIDAGENATKAFTDEYEANRTAEKDNFKKLDSLGTNIVTNPEELLTSIYKDLPRAQDFISIKENGTYYLKPYTGTIGEETYKQLKFVTRLLNSDNPDLGTLRNIRDNMGNKINFLTGKKEAMELSGMRRNLMDYMQEQVNAQEPDLKVRDFMRRYAINEQNRETMEKIFGGSISDKASFGKGIEPEKVLDRMFGSLENIKAAKAILGPKFDGIAANYLKQVINEAADPVKGFSSNKVGRTLDSKDMILKEALASHPEQLNKINATVNKMRALPDSPPGNPSDTASATNILKKIQGMGSLLLHPQELPGKLIQMVGGKLDQVQKRAAINKVLQGQSKDILEKNQALYSTYSKIERMGQKLNRSIDSSVKGIFNVGEKLKGITAKELIPKQNKEDFKRTYKKISNLSSNAPETIEKLASTTSDLQELAPNITNSLYMSAGRVTQFLASKLPVQPPSSPFSEPLEPSPTEIAAFNRYHQIAENPLSALAHIKNGTLTQEHIEGLSAMYPKIYAQMQNSIMDQLTSGKGKDLPYNQKLILSMFTGQDLTNSLKPQNIAMSQSILAAQAQPTPPKQGARSYSKIDKSSQLLTDNQKVESDKDRA